MHGPHAKDAKESRVELIAQKTKSFKRMAKRKGSSEKTSYPRLTPPEEI